MSGDKVRVLVAMLVGLVVGCAVINAVRGQRTVMRPSVNMALQPQPALFSQSKFMQPMKPPVPMKPQRASTHVSAMPLVQVGDISGLVPCAESKAFAKLQKKEVGGLEKRMKNYAPESAPAVALQQTVARTKSRFDFYRSSGLLCGSDGLPHLIADPGLALKTGHAGDVFLPTLGFLLVAGWIGESGRQYLQETKSPEKEIILDVPLALKCMGRACAWPATVLDELKTGKLTASDDDITVSPRL